MPVLGHRRVNGVPLGVILPSTMAPGQIGNFSTGAVTSTSISVSYTPAVGTSPITYVGWTSPHGVEAWARNGGSFGGTGGSFVGLNPNTNYDLRIVATNALGSSQTDLRSGVTTLAIAATSFSIALNRSSGAVGVAVTLTVTPGSGGWPGGQTVTPVVSGLVGTFDNNSLTASGTTPIVFTFTPASGPGTSGALSATASGMTNVSGVQSYSVNAIVATSNSTRYDLVTSSSAVAANSPVQVTIYPNASFPSGSVTLSGTNGTFSPSATVNLTASSTTPVTVSYTPNTAGEHSIAASNTAGMYNPYAAPLTVLSGGSGTARSIAVSLTRADMVTFQRDAPSGNPAGFSMSWAKGWGEVWLNITALAGASTGLWVRLYDALSSGASNALGTGIALHSSPVQIYGPISGTGAVRVLLPAGPYVYYADIATDAAFTNPTRVAQRFRVGVVIAHQSRSQESGLSRSYAYTGNVSLPTSYTKTAAWVGFDYRYSDTDSGWFVHDGVTVDPYQYHYGEASSSGAQEIGRLIESQLGVCVGITGSSATGGGLDSMVNHDGSIAGGFPGTVGTSVGNKFRYLWMATGGWDGVDAAYPTETHAEVRTRMLAAVDWIARTYPACAVIGWCAGASGVFGSDGSRPVGYTRNQMILLNEVEPTNPMVVSKECYSWNEYYQSHATMGARVQYVRAGFRQLMAAELSSFGGLQTGSRGPRVASSGTIASGSRVIRIPCTIANGASLQPVGISFSNPTYTVGTATSTELAALFAVYLAGGYQGNGQAIKIDSATINSAGGTIDLTLSGASGITYADGSSAVMPSAFTVQFAADFGASSNTSYPGSGRAILLADDRVDTANGIPHGWPMRPALDIAITTV